MAKSLAAGSAKPKSGRRPSAPRAKAQVAAQISGGPTEQGITQLVPTVGYFPARDGAATNTIGMIRTFAGTHEAFGAPKADGRLLPIKGHEPLFALLGFRFGGDGATNFALPDCKGRTAIGSPLATPDGDRAAPLPLTYLIAVDAPYPDRYPPTPILGSIAMFAGDFVPGGWLAAEGQMLEVALHPALARLLGSTYGGDGRTSFALPDLRGRAVIGAGGRPYSWQSLFAELGQVVGLGEGAAALGLNYIICMDGLYPDYRGDGAFPPNEAVVGEVVAFAGAEIPPGWALADGRSLQIGQHQALYSVFGETYGGDGRRMFMLPSLTGRVVVGPPS
jgi:microcystin-dependent protein